MSMHLKQKYIPQLDGIRAIAILLVIAFHWLPSGFYTTILPIGPIGVTLFFVLSGYLITDILIFNQPKEKKKILKTYLIFLARRSLRIFPIYFLVLFTVFVLHRFSVNIVTDFYSKPLYYWLYAYNFLLDDTGNWSDILSPYWSLSVEEQFYLFWGLIILSFKDKKKILWTVIILGIAFRYYSVIQNGKIGVSTLSCIDTFACGGLWSLYQNDSSRKWFEKIMNYLALVSLGFIIFMVLNKLTDKDLFKVLFFRTAVSWLSLKLIIFSIENKGLVYKLLTSAPFRIIGKISYGLYIYHMIFPIFLGIFLTRFNVQIQPYFFTILSLILLFIFSYLSWKIFELPINQLNKYVNYPIEE